MNNFLNTLLHEHSRIRAMLDHFRRQLVLFERNEGPDYDILNGSIAYCREYLDQWHHPKEEALLKLLRRRDPSALGSMDELTAQHETLAEATKYITNVFRDVVEGGGIYLREELVRRGLSMCTCYDQHLEWEEANFFPVVERTLLDDDWKKVGEEFKAVDPLDSSSVDDHYRALFLAISDASS